MKSLIKTGVKYGSKPFTEEAQNHLDNNHIHYSEDVSTLLLNVFVNKEMIKTSVPCFRSNPFHMLFFKCCYYVGINIV